MTIIITLHAAERFLQRVMCRETYSYQELNDTRSYLERLLSDVVVRAYEDYIALPGFEASFCAVCHENRVVTIIPKDSKKQSSNCKNSKSYKRIRVSNKSDFIFNELTSQVA